MCFHFSTLCDDSQLRAQVLAVTLQQKKIHAPFEDPSFSRPDKQNTIGLAPGDFISRGYNVIMGFELHDICFHRWHKNYTIEPIDS